MSAVTFELKRVESYGSNIQQRRRRNIQTHLWVFRHLSQFQQGQVPPRRSRRCGSARLSFRPDGSEFIGVDVVFPSCRGERRVLLVWPVRDGAGVQASRRSGVILHREEGSEVTCRGSDGEKKGRTDIHRGPVAEDGYYDAVVHPENDAFTCLTCDSWKMWVTAWSFYKTCTACFLHFMQIIPYDEINVI